MERLLGFILGGAALALYAPFMFVSGTGLQKYQQWLVDNLGQGWLDKLYTLGPGVFAGIALILIAIRSKS